MRDSRTATLKRDATTVVVVLAASAVFGGLTSPAQGLLPDELLSLANSVSGWTMLTAALVWAVAPRTGLAALLGPLSFVGAVLGYTEVSQLRGLYYDPLLWGLVGLVAGPFVGVAASWLRDRGWRAGIGTGVLSGILLGDCWFGLTVVAATTSWVYWTLVGCLGVALLLVMSLRRVSRWRDAAVAVIAALVVAGALLVGYRLLDVLLTSR